MPCILIACQQFVAAASFRQADANGEIWRLVAGFEAIAVIVLLIANLTANRHGGNSV